MWDPAHSPLWPPGCQSVLEAKIEIPDTPVVNFAHASPALEQDLLYAAVSVSSRMWNMQEMRLDWRKVPHNILPSLHPLTRVLSECGWMSLFETEFLSLGDGEYTAIRPTHNPKIFIYLFIYWGTKLIFGTSNYLKTITSFINDTCLQYKCNLHMPHTQ